MPCAACGHDSRETAKFCDACGAALALKCAQCSAELRTNAKFCDACGAAVRGSGFGDQGPATNPQTPTPSPKFQPHVQYVTTSDGVRIAYATFGAPAAAVPLVVCVVTF